MAIPIISDFIEAISIAINPSANTKASITASKVAGLYYKSLIIPLLASIIAVSIFKSLTAPYNFAAIVDALLFLPLFFLVAYVALHIIGARIFKYAKEDPSKTLVSIFYAGSAYVSIQLIWNTIRVVFGITNSTIFLVSEAIIYIWFVLILTMAYSNQQKISKKKAFYAVLTAGILFAVLIAILWGLFSSFAHIVI